jgi:hypothetical protein
MAAGGNPPLDINATLSVPLYLPMVGEKGANFSELGTRWLSEHASVTPH